jgi:hypothetical protein
MGYYENPPMIQPDRSGMIIAESIVKSSESVAKGIMMAGERRREEEKERKLTIQKLQDQKNKIDLLYNDKISDWSKTQGKANPELTNKIYGLIDSKIKLAADSQIALLSETNTEKRNEYLKNIRTADQFLNNSAKFGELIAMDTATWREAAKGLKVGVPGGFVVNGKNDQEIMDNTSAIEILGGMDQAYADTLIHVEPDVDGDGVNLVVSGKRKEDGSSFSAIINSKEYIAADVSGNGGFLLPVESLDDFYKQAKKDVVDDKGNIYTGYINEKRETVDLPSSGRDVYQLRNGQRLQDKAIKAKISEQSNIRAEGIIANYNPSNLRTLIDYTLGNQPGYYDKNFKALTPAAQKEELSKMLTNKSFDGMTRSLEKTKDANGDTVYWNPSADISIKPKEGKGGSGSGTSDKEEPSTYKEEYYNSIITGLDPSKKDKDPAMAAYQERSSLVENLNKLSGSNKFATRDELFNRWKKQEYKSGDYATGKTMEEHYKEEGKNITNAFAKLYPFQNGYVYVEKSANNFVPVKGYNINKATDRVKLALDQTSDAGERKILQKKLKDARLMDWMKINTRKSNETTEQYAARARKAGF